MENEVFYNRDKMYENIPNQEKRLIKDVEDLGKNVDKLGKDVGAIQGGTGVGQAFKDLVARVENQGSNLDTLARNVSDMITINVRDFGVVADADFFNEADNKYYADASFSKPATDNKNAFLDILYYINGTGKGRYKILFPRGNYYSSRSLEVTGKEITIEGVNAKLITSAPNSGVEVQCVHVRDCQGFRCYGMTFENIIEDKTTTNDYTGRYYHLWIRENLYSDQMEYCHIYDNIFIDKVSIPNTIAKPYNGSLCIDHIKNVFVHNNKFLNNCGRIVYVTGCENVNVHDNQFRNIGYISPEITSVQVGTLVFRVLSSKHVKIHHNTVIGTETFNTNSLVYGVMLAMNEETTIVDEDVRIDSNTFVVNKTKMDVFRISCADGCSFTNNDVYLNNSDAEVVNTFIYIDPLNTYPYEQALNITFDNNRVYNSHETMFYIGTLYDVDKMNVYLNGNQFDSATAITKISDYHSDNMMTRGVLRMYNNRVTKKGVYQYDLVTTQHIDYNNNPYKRSIVVTATNMTDYIDANGVLSVPLWCNEVIFNVAIGTPVNINDIKVDGQHLLGKEIALRHLALEQPTIYHNNSLIRLAGAANIKMQLFQMVRLKYSLYGYWVTY
jgi:hypothetical protein